LFRLTGGSFSLLLFPIFHCIALFFPQGDFSPLSSSLSPPPCFLFSFFLRLRSALPSKIKSGNVLFSVFLPFFLSFPLQVFFTPFLLLLSRSHFYSFYMFPRLCVGLVNPRYSSPRVSASPQLPFASTFKVSPSRYPVVNGPAASFPWKPLFHLN